MVPQITIKRIYETPSESDGYRVLVDRLWPRGVSKEKATLDEWAKELTPTDEIRKSYGHHIENWLTFKYRYVEELKQNEMIAAYLEKWEEHHVITFLYAARDTQHTHALILQEYIQNLYNLKQR